MRRHLAALTACVALLACGGGDGGGGGGNLRAVLTEANAEAASAIAFALAETAMSIARDSVELTDAIRASGGTEGTVPCRSSGHLDWSLPAGAGTSLAAGTVLVSARNCAHVLDATPMTGSVLELRYAGEPSDDRIVGSAVLLDHYRQTISTFEQFAVTGSVGFEVTRVDGRSELRLDAASEIVMRGASRWGYFFETLKEPAFKRVVDTLQGYLSQSIAFQHESQLLDGRIDVTSAAPLVSDMVAHPYAGSVSLQGRNARMEVATGTATGGLVTFLVPVITLGGTRTPPLDWRQLATNDFWWPDGLLPRNTAIATSVRELRILRDAFVADGAHPGIDLILSRPIDATAIGDVRFHLMPDLSVSLDGDPKRVDWGASIVGARVDVRGTRVSIRPTEPLHPGRFYSMLPAAGTGLRDAADSPLWRDIHGGTALMILGGVSVPDTVRARARFALPDASVVGDRLALTAQASNRGLENVPSIVSWRWTQVSGPEVEFGNADASSTDLRFTGGFPAAPTEVVVDLEVRNAAGDVDHDRLAVTVYPTAVSGPVLYMRTNPGSFIGLGATRRYESVPPGGMPAADARGFEIWLEQGPGLPQARFAFRMPIGQVLVPGTYTRRDWEQAGIVLESGTNGVAIALDGHSCSSPPDWRVTVHEYVVDATGGVLKLDADFDAQGTLEECANTWVYGGVRIGSTRALQP